MISIDIGKSAVGGLEDIAASFAEQWQGVVSEGTLEVDGVEALRVVISDKPAALQPKECIVVHYGDRACLLIGGTKGDKPISEVLDAIAKTWKWKE
ncbi:MAG: hypothetical protein CMJ64_30040 [Planctomycetaceae bacterium]|nr:hypothetical protein [Planctomycetaceae bacterium]